MRSMAYRHKLSRMVALLVFIVAVVSCQQPSAAPAVPPPPPPPPGATILVQETFEDQAFAAHGWYDNLALTTTTAQHIPGSTRALEAHFTAGRGSPPWGGAAPHPVAPARAGGWCDRVRVTG